MQLSAGLNLGETGTKCPRNRAQGTVGAHAVYEGPDAIVVDQRLELGLPRNPVKRLKRIATFVLPRLPQSSRAVTSSDAFLCCRLSPFVVPAGDTVIAVILVVFVALLRG